MTNTPRSIALVLETNNLRGGGGDARALADRATASLERLLAHLRAQTLPLGELRALVVTHDGLEYAQRERVSRAAGRPVRFVAIDAGVGYYEAKNRGFDATPDDARVVVFADADCWPDPRWLEALCAAFDEDPACAVTAGRTTYRDGVLGAAATSMDFMYFPSPLGAGCTRNFYANNVAFAREVFARFRYVPAPEIYRGHCQQLGLRLFAAGVAVRYVHAAHTVHRFPDSARELLRLRLLRGTDTVAMAPHLARSLLPPRLRWLGHTGPLAPMLVLGARLGFSARALGSQGMRGARGAKRGAALVAMCGLSAADAAGALGRAVLKRDMGVHDGSLVRDALTYHGDGDALAGAPHAR